MIRLLLLLAFAAQPVAALSQFSHEELIDLLWMDSIRPLLLQRYPGTTEAGLNEAHAYAYGGCLIQDIGYYPFGKKYFSDLAHYVRSGDLVTSMLRNARTVDEFAFAIGALSHYLGDTIGHAEATNPATADTFPDLRAKYGPIVTYEEAPTAHGRTEMGFDVAEEQFRRYAPAAYRKAIHFSVPRRLVAGSFLETYGISAQGVLGPARAAVASYRRSARSLLPAFLNAERVILRSRLPGPSGSAAQEQLLRDIARTEYATQWAGAYREPGIVAHILSVVIRLIPKIGILKVLSVKPPSTATEELLLRSMNHAAARFRELIARLGANPPRDLELESLDLDTGRPVAPGRSRMVDKAYLSLLTRVTHGDRAIPAALRESLLTYFADLDGALRGALTPKELRKARQGIELLRRLPTDGPKASLPDPF